MFDGWKGFREQSFWAEEEEGLRERERERYRAAETQERISDGAQQREISNFKRKDRIEQRFYSA